VFVSSHLMSEMENTADDIIVIGRGKLIANTTIEKFIAENSTETIRVRTPQIDVMAKAVAAAGGTATANGDGSLLIQGMPTERVGDVAFEAGVRLHELSQTHASLEQAFMELTADSVEYHAGGGGTGSANPAGPASGADPATAGQPADTAAEQAQAGRTS
jgi:ABC-2 type transport system ATP-binding protein